MTEFQTFSKCQTFSMLRFLDGQALNYCPKILWVPGTPGTRANSSPALGTRQRGVHSFVTIFTRTKHGKFFS